MTAVYILAAIILLLALLLMLRVGVRAKYDEAGAEVFAVAGPVRIKLYPAEKNRKKREKKPKKSKKTEEKTEEKAEKKPGKGGPLKELRELWPSIKAALGKFRRKLSVDELTIHFTSGGKDASKTAITYGASSAALGMAASFLEHNLKIKKRDFGTGFDFSAREPVIYVRVQMTLRVWQLISIALGPLGAFLRQRKRKEEK